MTTPVAEPVADEDGFTEIRDAEFTNLDTVGAAANGTKWFFAKEAADSLVPPEVVRELLGETEPAAAVNVTGPAALIHGAPVRKAEAATDDPAQDESEADKTPKAEPVAKADGTETAADAAPDLDVTTVMAEPEGAASDGSAEVPGSPAWEATDAATARKWSVILARAKVALETLSDREAIEAAGPDPSDIEASWDLSDAACAIDYALGILAPFAIGEQIEAESAGEMAAVGKALTGMDPDAPDTIAFLAVHAAAGALSEPNVTAMREAAAELRKAVTALPRQPAPEPEPEVAKAEKTAVAVYDAHGVLVGVCDPDDITPVTQVTAKTTGDEMTEPKATEPDGATTTTDAALIPGTQTVASPPKAEEDDAKVQKAVQAALAPLTEAIAELAKQVSQGADVAGSVNVLKERVEQLAKMPDDRNPPLLNGATGTAGIAARDGAVADPYAELTKAVETATTPAERLDAQHQLSYAKVRDRFTPR